MNVYKYTITDELYLKLSDYKNALQGKKSVTCIYSPKELESMYVADCTFPNGEVFQLRKTSLNLKTAKKIAQ